MPRSKKLIEFIVRESPGISEEKLVEEVFGPGPNEDEMDLRSQLKDMATAGLIVRRGRGKVDNPYRFYPGTSSDAPSPKKAAALPKDKAPPTSGLDTLAKTLFLAGLIGFFWFVLGNDDKQKAAQKAEVDKIVAEKMQALSDSPHVRPPRGSRSFASNEEKLGIYGIAMGRASACGFQYSALSRKFGKWVDNTWQGTEREVMLLTLVEGMRLHAQRQAAGDSEMTCTQVLEELMQLPEP